MNIALRREIIKRGRVWGDVNAEQIREMRRQCRPYPVTHIWTKGAYRVVQQKGARRTRVPIIC